MSEQTELVWAFLGKKATCPDGGQHRPIALKDAGWPTEYLFDMVNRGGEGFNYVGFFVCDKCGCLYAAHRVTK
jgi:hypothetical protein